MERVSPRTTLRTTLVITGATTGGEAHLALRGELDCSSAPELRSRIGEVLAAGAGAVVVDLARLSFIDAAGLGVLIGAERQLRERNGHLDLRRVPRPVQRVLEVAGVTGFLQLRPPEVEDPGAVGTSAGAQTSKEHV